MTKKESAWIAARIKRENLNQLADWANEEAEKARREERQAWAALCDERLERNTGPLVVRLATTS